MKFPVSIESNAGPLLARQVFDGATSISIGMAVGAPGGVDLTLQSMTEHRAFDVPGTLEFIAETAVNLDVGLFSAWLYDKVKGQGKAKVTISETELETDDEEFREKLRIALTELLNSDEAKHNK